MPLFVTARTTALYHSPSSGQRASTCCPGTSGMVLGSVFRCARASTATDAVLACLSVDREAIYAGFATLFARLRQQNDGCS